MKHLLKSGRSMRFAKFKLVDTNGQMWVIPCEIVPTKFTSHVFVVHKALSLEEEGWTVSHERTYASVGHGKTKEEAIAAAKAALALVNAKEFQERVDDMMVKRPSVTVREMLLTERPPQ